jgi:hypothetical protein
MAALAVTFDTTGGRTTAFPNKIRRGTLALGTYATNGVAVTGTNFELYNTLSDLRVDPASGYTFEYVKSTGKVKAYWQRDSAGTTYDKVALTEVDNATDLSSVTSRFRAEGR